MASLWQLEGVRLGPAIRPRFRCATLSIQAGITAVLGQSGAGKTSLLNLLVGFESPDAGRVQGPPAVSQGHLPLYWVPQDGGLWPHLDAEQHLCAVALDQAAGDWLPRFGLEAVAGQRPGSLSVGQRARLSVARALAAQAAVLVMDEPLAHVDGARAPTYWQVVMETVRARDASLVFATHEPDRILGSADRVILVADGQVTYDGATDALYRQPANRELATALGPANWWTAAEAAALLGTTAAGQGPCCLRPHEVELVADPAGPLTVSALRVCGAVTNATLTLEAGPAHEVVGTMHASLAIGDRARLRVRSAS